MVLVKFGVSFKTKMHQIKSVFEEISTYVFTSTDTLTEQKRYVINFIESKRINDKDKKVIIRNVNDARSTVRLQTYICNSLLQYEGLGMNNFSGGGTSKEDIDNFQENFG